MELKLAHELTSIDQDPLFLFFVDLRKAYDTVDRDRLLITLEGYGTGPRMCRLLETFWYFHQVVLRQNGFLGPTFPDTRGTMQGVLVSPTMFNVMVENTIRTCLAITVEYQRVSHDGQGDTFGQFLGVLYANNGMVGSHESYWIQQTMNVLISLFRRYGLASNVTKSRTMTCQPGALQASMPEEAMVMKYTGVGDSYQVIIRRRVPCL